MRNLALIGGAAFLAITSPALAGTASGTLDVTMTVANNCTLSSGGGGDVGTRAAGGTSVVDFGTQDAGINQLPIDGSTSGAFGGDIVLNCTGESLSPQISFDAGNNPNGNQRQMAYTDGKVGAVAYDLHIDSGRVNPLLPNQFYDLVPDALPDGLKSGDNIITVYARVPAGQPLFIGTLGDTVKFAVSY